MSDVDVDESAATDPASVEPEIERRYGAAVVEDRGQVVLHPTRDAYLDVVAEAYDDGFVLLADITATDYLTHPGRALPPEIVAERFEIVVNLVDPIGRRRIRLRTQVPEDDPTVPTLYERFPGCDAPEREVLDMFGIAFEGHPDPTRILMPEDWDGHPLRKDYAQGRIPVQFKSASNVR